MRKDIILLFAFLTLVLNACEKSLPSVPLRSGTPVLNVDGWITDREAGDTIRLTKTIDFFDQHNVPPVTGQVSCFRMIISTRNSWNRQHRACL
ncbi:DUF4249 family protein [Chitinophaga pinensis]|uniref:DUF4249 family protein n=1 Tax=Chitinophaga pinensis TaxID=79329 RepID=UPI0001A2EDCF|nr:DUF4249 family protein [Chitinophaga pinensis]